MLNSHPAGHELAPLNGSAPSHHNSAPLVPHSPPTPAPTGPARADVLDVGAMLSALWRRRRLMLTTFALVFLAGTLLTLRQRSVYEAKCSILISSPSEGGASAAGDSLRSLLSASQPRSVGTQLAIMRSYPVQRATIKRLSPAEQQTAKQFHSLEVRPQRDSDAIDIVAQSYDPRVAARLANALREEYMAQSQEQNHQQVLANTREVASQLAGAQKRLNRAAGALKDFKLKSGTNNFGEESSARLAQSSQIEVALRDAQAERDADVARIQSLQGQIAGQPRIQTVPDRIVRSPRLEALRGQLVQLDLQRIATLRRYRPGSPEVQSIDLQRADLASQIQSVTKTEIGSWTRSLNPIRQRLSEDIAQAQTRIASTDARMSALRTAAERARAQEALLPEREYQLNQLLGDQTTLQQTYQLLNEKYQSLLVSEGAKLTTARQLEPAEAPGSPIKPRRTLNLILTVLLGTCAAIALGLLADHMDDRVRSVQGAQNAAGLPVLAQIPAASGARRLMPAGTEGFSPSLESFRLLRTALLLPGADGSLVLPRSILVTSPREGEDPSQCALNLAIAVAASGREVLLIEADLRQPSLYSLLGLGSERGLGEVLRGELALGEAIQPTGVPHLRFLGGGAHIAGASELLDTDGARHVLQAAIERCDCAILNCPPVLGLADTPILATIAQCAVLVVSSEESQGSEIAQAREVLARTGIWLPGLVLDGVKAGR